LRERTERDFDEIGVLGFDFQELREHAEHRPPDRFTLNAKQQCLLNPTVETFAAFMQTAEDVDPTLEDRSPFASFRDKLRKFRLSRLQKSMFRLKFVEAAAAGPQHALNFLNLTLETGGVAPKPAEFARQPATAFRLALGRLADFHFLLRDEPKIGLAASERLFQRSAGVTAFVDRRPRLLELRLRFAPPLLKFNQRLTATVALDAVESELRFPLRRLQDEFRGLPTEVVKSFSAFFKLGGGDVRTPFVGGEIALKRSRPLREIVRFLGMSLRGEFPFAQLAFNRLQAAANLGEFGLDRRLLGRRRRSFGVQR
jgi:hypothetical protein